MDACDTRLTAYRGGRTFRDCREAARALAPKMLDEVRRDGRVRWDRIMERAEFDAVVYKLCLKYMREAGCDIGDHRSQFVSRGA